MLKLITAFTSILFLFSCGNRKWTDDDRKKVIADCIESAKKILSDDKAKAYCECMQPIMEAKYPTVAEANKVTPADMEKSDMKAAALKCMQ